MQKEASNHNTSTLIIMRLVANMIDNILVSLLTFFIVVILTFSSFEIFSISNFIDMFTWDLTVYEVSGGSLELLQGVLFFILYLFVTYILVGLAYFQALLSSSFSSTFGMRIFSLVLQNSDGSKPSGVRVFSRNVLFVVFKFIYVGAFSILTMFMTKKSQALHDMATATQVVIKK